jgi:hypothetical protein
MIGTVRSGNQLDNWGWDVLEWGNF